MKIYDCEWLMIRWITTKMFLDYVEGKKSDDIFVEFEAGYLCLCLNRFKTAVENQDITRNFGWK